MTPLYCRLLMIGMPLSRVVPNDRISMSRSLRTSFPRICVVVLRMIPQSSQFTLEIVGTKVRLAMSLLTPELAKIGAKVALMIGYRVPMRKVAGSPRSEERRVG